MNEEEILAVIEYVEQLENNVAHLQEKCLLLETQRDIAKAKLHRLEQWMIMNNIFQA
jgi:hypothetical protein